MIRLASFARSRIGQYALCALALAPAILAMWYIFTANTDVVFSDLWGHIPMVKNFLEGKLELSELFAAHNQNRPVVLNIFILTSVMLDHFDVKHLIFLTALFQLITLYIFVKMTSDMAFPIGTRPIFYVIVSMLIFNLGQFENYTLSINSVFASCVTFSLLAIVAWQRCLDGPRSLASAATAVACCELATFSMGGGVVIWPVLVAHTFLYGLTGGGLRKRALLLLLAVGASTIALYGIGMEHMVSIGNVLTQLAQPVKSAQFMLVTFGASALGFLRNKPRIVLDEAIGIVNCLTYAFALTSWLRLSPPEKRARLPLFSAILFTFAEVGLIWLGRAKSGFDVAASARYTTLTVIGLAASFALVLERARLSTAYQIYGAASALIIVCAVVVSDFSEVRMAGSRKSYEEALVKLLDTGEISAANVAPLEWFDVEGILEGVATLKKYKLSQFHVAP